MNLIKFDDGTYGVVRKTFWGKEEFRDLYAPLMWWRKKGQVDYYCKGTLEQATRAYNWDDKFNYTVIK